MSQLYAKGDITPSSSNFKEANVVRGGQSDSYAKQKDGLDSIFRAETLFLSSSAWCTLSTSSILPKFARLHVAIACPNLLSATMPKVSITRLSHHSRLSDIHTTFTHSR